jgi:1-phosphofructokinase
VPEADGEFARVAVFAPVPMLTVELEPVDAQADDELADLHLHAGGQGFWVARMVRALRAHPLLCGPFGGESGRTLRALIEHEGVEARTVDMEHPNASAVEDHRGEHTRALAFTELPALARHEVDEIYTITVGAAIEAGTCVLTGTQNADVVPDDVYRRLVADLTANDVRCVADLCGAPLRGTLAGGRTLLKLSHEELEADGWSKGNTADDVIAGIDALRDAGAHDVVVSRAGDPAIAWLDGQLLEARAPQLEVVEPRGAGDSMTAALAVSLARGAALDEALRLAMAAGALNVTRHGLATGHADAIEQLATKVEIDEFSRARS